MNLFSDNWPDEILKKPNFIKEYIPNIFRREVEFEHVEEKFKPEEQGINYLQIYNHF